MRGAAGGPRGRGGASVVAAAAAPAARCWTGAGGPLPPRLARGEGRGAAGRRSCRRGAAKREGGSCVGAPATTGASGRPQACSSCSQAPAARRARPGAPSGGRKRSTPLGFPCGRPAAAGDSLEGDRCTHRCGERCSRAAARGSAELASLVAPRLSERAKRSHVIALRRGSPLSPAPRPMQRSAGGAPHSRGQCTAHQLLRIVSICVRNPPSPPPAQPLPLHGLRRFQALSTPAHPPIEQQHGSSGGRSGGIGPSGRRQCPQGRRHPAPLERRRRPARWPQDSQRVPAAAGAPQQQRDGTGSSSRGARGGLCGCDGRPACSSPEAGGQPLALPLPALLGPSAAASRAHMH